ncbi:hypothetical protein SDC9_92640 [bioreactor metagenome]|uniref:Uncharacterized protein n=1 Tax=bioreactor metagenome TaxID=1076179 RepID=A0A644ZYZ2_9ZZZZ
MVVGFGHQDGVVAGLCGVQDAADHRRGVAGDRHLVRDEPERLGAAGTQPACRAVGRVAEFLGDRTDALSGCFGNARARTVVEHHAHSGRRQARTRRYVGECDPLVHAFSLTLRTMLMGSDNHFIRYGRHDSGRAKCRWAGFTEPGSGRYTDQAA